VIRLTNIFFRQISFGFVPSPHLNSTARILTPGDAPANDEIASFASALGHVIGIRHPDILLANFDNGWHIRVSNGSAPSDEFGDVSWCDASLTGSISTAVCGPGQQGDGSNPFRMSL
jgi:hypothetical protein